MAKRSNKQSEIYDFIREQIRIKGYPPSVREICTAVGLKSTSTVHAHLAKLEQMGYIKRDSTKPRAIELLKDSIINKEMIDIPIVGKVAAGKPILAVENIEEYFSLPINFVKNDKDLFILKVKGDSMVGAGILDGDFAIIEKDNSANNGNIIVALIDGEATIKRFFKKEDHIILQPENKYMKPIIVKECSIVGKLVGIYRKY